MATDEEWQKLAELLERAGVELGPDPDVETLWVEGMRRGRHTSAPKVDPKYHDDVEPISEETKEQLQKNKDAYQFTDSLSGPEIDAIVLDRGGESIEVGDHTVTYLECGGLTVDGEAYFNIRMRDSREGELAPRKVHPPYLATLRHPNYGNGHTILLDTERKAVVTLEEQPPPSMVEEADDPALERQALETLEWRDGGIRYDERLWETVPYRVYRQRRDVDFEELDWEPLADHWRASSPWPV